MASISVEDILQADDLRHEAGLYTVASTTARALELFHEYQNAVPDNPMKFNRVGRATLRGKSGCIKFNNITLYVEKNKNSVRFILFI